MKWGKWLSTMTINKIPTQMTIQQQLRAARKSANLSQGELSKLINVKRPNITAYESGRHPNPTHELIQKWVNATGYTFTITPEISENSQ